MKHTLLISILTIVVLFYASAQKKQVSYEQAFGNVQTNITKPLPQINKWIDNERYLETRKDTDGKTKTFAVKAKTGESALFEEAKPLTDQKDFAAPKNAKNLTWSPDGKWAAFTLDNDLYIRSAETEKDIRLTSDGSETIKNGFASWVYFEEILGRGSAYRAFWWSRDSRHICFMRFDDAKVPVFPIYVPKAQHGYLENQRYPKSGDTNPEVKIGIVDIATQNTTWVDFNEKDDQYFGPVIWTPEGQLWVQWINRGQDHYKIYKVEITSGRKAELYEEKQSTWVTLNLGSRFEFLQDNKHFMLKSDRSGWMHLYLHDMSGKLVNQITSGEFTVGEVFKIDEKAKMICFAARKENSTRWDLYSSSLDGKRMSRHSFGDFSFSGMLLSPDSKHFITSYSNLGSPARMVLMDMKGNIVRELGDAKGNEYASFDLPKKELARVKSSDGLFDLPVLITYPLNFDPSKKYPVLASIYGGPGAGRIMDSWQISGADLWWAKEGLIQVVFDNRSSGHFGKKGMDFIHRQMGKYEIEDYMQCGKWLKEKPFIDKDRFGITGNSFGGYMTCMALTYGADVFTHGVAIASVTDWQFYDTHYTERYMDAPKENPEGYKLTSVMTHAGKLKGLLRIVHGTSDDNVHMQNSLVLVDKLQDLKKNFEFMLYPGERHGIGGNNPAKGDHNRSANRHFFYEYLLQKPTPEAFWKEVPARGF